MFVYSPLVPIQPEFSPIHNANFINIIILAEFLYNLVMATKQVS